MRSVCANSSTVLRGKEIAKAVRDAMLASVETSYTTGAEVGVGGGMLAGPLATLDNAARRLSFAEHQLA
jgi:hypothetical protein